MSLVGLINFRLPIHYCIHSLKLNTKQQPMAETLTYRQFYGVLIKDNMATAY